MDPKRFDLITRLVGSSTSRRSLLRGLAGIIGGTSAAVIGSELDTEARRRSNIVLPPPPPVCPGQVPCPTAQTCCDQQQCNQTLGRCCPAGTEPCPGGCCAICASGVSCGFECCETSAQCCGGECCAAGSECIGEPPGREETCCPIDQLCRQNPDQPCCPAGSRCCDRGTVFQSAFPSTAAAPPSTAQTDR